jgi:hypothetical protein
LQQFRIVDVSGATISPSSPILKALSPEAAAREHFGFEVVRSGHRKDLVARVYWQLSNQPMSMVRMYRKVGQAGL